MHLTDLIYIKKLEKEQQYKDAKKRGQYINVLQRQAKLQEELFMKCLERYHAYHDRMTGLENILEVRRQHNKWNEQKKIEQQRMMQREKAACLFEEQILENERQRQKEFGCIEDQLEDAKRKAQEAKKMANGLKKYIAYCKLLRLESYMDQIRMQMLLKAEENNQFWRERINRLQQQNAKMQESDKE